MNSKISAFSVEFFEDRYGGVYSRGQWIAYLPVGESPSEVGRSGWLRDNGPNGCDLEAAEFWGDPPSWMAAADSKAEALAKLASYH